MVKIGVVSLVGIILSVSMLILGIFLLIHIGALKDIIPEYPFSKDIIVKVDPLNSQQGTVFLVKAIYKATWTKLEDTDNSLLLDGIALSIGYTF